jgi:hypothetical protein
MCHILRHSSQMGIHIAVWAVQVVVRTMLLLVVVVMQHV